MKLLFICGNGVSSGMIAQKTRKAGKARGYDVESNAYSYAQLNDVIDSYDVVLVAPQMKFNEENIKTICDKHNKKFSIIDSFIFSTLDGDKCFDLALSLTESQKNV